MNDIIFNNSDKISKNNSVEKIISNMIAKHPRVPKGMSYIKHINFSMHCVNYILEKGTKEDFNCFLAEITENSDFISFKEFNHLSLSIPHNLKSTFFSYIEDIVFNIPFLSEDGKVVSEEKYRHKLIFEMANFMDNDLLIKRWCDMEDFYTKTARAQPKGFSIKSILFWELQAYKNHNFYNTILKNKASLLCSSPSDINSIASYPEDILFSCYNFENKNETVKFFNDFKKIRNKNNNKIRKEISMCIEDNKELSAKKLLELISFYKETIFEEHTEKSYKNIYRTALSAFVRNRWNNKEVDNEFFDSYFTAMEKDIGPLSSTELSTFLAICLLNIENKKTLDLIEEKISLNQKNNHSSADSLSLRKIESYYNDYRFNVNLENKPTKEDIYSVLTILHKNGFNMNKIFSLFIFDEQMKPNQHKQADIYIKHYFPVFIDFFLNNNLTFSKKESEKMVQYFEKEGYVSKFFVNKIKESLISLLKDSNLKIENVSYLFKKTKLKDIPEFKIILVEKEKQALLTDSLNTPSKVSKKRI